MIHVITTPGPPLVFPTSSYVTDIKVAHILLCGFSTQSATSQSDSYSGTQSFNMSASQRARKVLQCAGELAKKSASQLLSLVQTSIQ